MKDAKKQRSERIKGTTEYYICFHPVGARAIIVNHAERERLREFTQKFLAVCLCVRVRVRVRVFTKNPQTPDPR